MKHLVLQLALVSLAAAQNKPGNESGLPTGVANGSVWVSNAVSRPGGHLIKPVIDVTDQGFIGNGSTDNTTAANTLLTAIGATQTTILFPAGRYVIGSVTFPTNVALDFTKGAMLSPSTGHTITIAGPILASPTRIFTNIASEQGAISLAGNRTLTGISPLWFGLDCSGVRDNAAIWNQILSITGDDSTFILPQNCVDMHASTVTVSSRAGFKLISEDRAQNGGGNQRPQELWTGTRGGMWYFQANQAPTIEGFSFQNTSTARIAYFLDFDGNPAARIGTEAQVRYNTFTNNIANPSSFSAISINTVSGQNHEKNVITDNDFVCSQSAAFRESDSGQISKGSNVLTCGLANCTYTTDASVGERVRISYASGILDTTIQSITDNNHLVMTAPATSTQSNARTTFGEAYGYGITIGSVNAKHNTLERLSFIQCAHGLNVINGSFSAKHFGGYNNDVLAYIGDLSEPSELEYMESESTMREVQTGASMDSPLTLRHLRNSIYAAESDGFLYFGNTNGSTRILISESELQTTPTTNSVLIRAANPQNMALTSFANQWGPGVATMANLGFTPFQGLSPRNGNFLISCGDFGILDAPASCFQYGGAGPLKLDGPATVNGLTFGTDNANDIGATGAHRPRNVYAATQFISQVAKGTAPFSIASTTPVANLIVSNHPTLDDCGTTSTCSATQKTAALIVRGSVAFPTATTVTVTSLPFTSSSSYSCTAGDQTTAAGVVNATAYTSGSSVTFTETSGVNTDTMRYICVGF